MSDLITNNEEHEAFSFGMAFMAFLMAIAALNGIWFLALLIKMLTKMIK